jgi:Alginate export
VHEAFADVTLIDGVRLRLGRQEVAFGTGRLISAAEGLNVRRSFDGARLIITRGSWQFNSTAMRLVAAQRGLFDDKSDDGQTVWGTGGYGAHPLIKGSILAVYYFGLDRDTLRVDEGIGHARRHVLGTRTVGRRGNFDHDQEAIVQWGHFERDDIRAWALAVEQGYTFSDRPMRPRVGYRAFIASGDHHRDDDRLGSFDPLFPGTAYSGKAALLGPTNLITIDPSVRLAVHPRVGVTADWAWFWRTRIEDGVYGIGGTLIRTGRLSGARAVGQQGTIEIEWRADRHVTIFGTFVGFRAGRFLRDTPPGDDIRYVALQAAYRF